MCVCRLPMGVGLRAWACTLHWNRGRCSHAKFVRIKKRSYPLKNNSWYYFPYLMGLPAVVYYLFSFIFLPLQFAVIIIITLLMFIHVEFS